MITALVVLYILAVYPIFTILYRTETTLLATDDVFKSWMLSFLWPVLGMLWIIVFYIWLGLSYVDMFYENLIKENNI